MNTRIQDTQRTIAANLEAIAWKLPPDGLTLRALLVQVGEHGLLLFCIILAIPFLLPVALPGVSTVFGALILLISLGIIFNRLPWLPPQLIDRKIAAEQLRPLLLQGARLFRRVERFNRVRLPALTQPGLANRFNGVILLTASVLLMLPLGIFPFSNAIPAWGIVLLAAGMAQRDGLFVLAGYVLTLIGCVYVGAIFALALVAGQGVAELLMQG